MVSPGHREAGPEIVTGTDGAVMVITMVWGLPVPPPQPVELGVTESVYAPGAAVPQSMVILADAVVPFGVVKDAPAGNPSQV